jgi:hypothetical protein
VPHYFLDPDLHKVVVWELPEISFKQSAEVYIRELGLLYIDVVFVLFSDKYLLSDVYCSLIVAMAIHGIPFFVICTPSSESVTEEDMKKIKADFQRKDVQGIRIFNPSKPHETMTDLLGDFVKEVSWNRGKQSQEGASDGVSEAVLGQTVRLKNLEKKPELNGRCGVCIGYDKSTDRYLARIITDGVEQDISLKQTSFSILKPRLLNQIVRVKGLEKKPELNGRYGFVDEFLREAERYRVFLPDRPGSGLVLALKPDNLEKAESIQGARPITAADSAPQLPTAAAKPTSSLPSKNASAPAPKAAASSPVSSSTTTKNTKSFDPPARKKPPENSRPQDTASSTDGGAADKSIAPDAKQVPRRSAPSAQDPTTRESSDAVEGLTKLFADSQDERRKTTDGDDLMSRIFAAEGEVDAEDAKPSKKEQDTKKPPMETEKPVVRPRLQLSLQGLLGLRVWAVVGDPDESEEIVDHLMDCGKTVFSVCASGGAHFASTADLNTDPSLPNTEVLAFVDPHTADVSIASLDAKRLGIRGVLFHPEASVYGPEAVDVCRDAGLTVHSADLLSTVQPGTGLPVAPLD